MPHKVHASRIPSTARTVHRFASSSSTLYTVPVGKTLVLLSAWVTVGQPNTTPVAGNFRILCNSEDDGSAQVIAAACCGDVAGQANSCETHAEIRVPAGSTVSCSLTGLTGAQTLCGFAGYLESA